MSPAKEQASIQMSQAHLEYSSRVNLGSHYTPDEIVARAWQMIGPHVRPRTTVTDSACGYGDFLKNFGQAVTLGCDIDETAVKAAGSNNDKARFFHANALHRVSRGKFGIDRKSHLIMVGNPPYNDRTSLIRQSIKDVSFDIDGDLASRDLGISFLRSYNKLKADLVCVLHPLSYLIKPANFRMLKDFAANYRLIDSLLISSWKFPESTKLTPFPIVLALYRRDPQGMDCGFIRSFRFRIPGKGDFCVGDFDYIAGYIDKYPKKKNRPTPGKSLSSRGEEGIDRCENKDPLFFWTMRDINALKRNRTFVEHYSENTIVIDKRKLDYYAYVDVFKRNLHRLPFYLGNCDVLVDDELFRQYNPCFISDAIRHHSLLKKHFHMEPMEKKQAEAGLDTYFKSLLGAHHV